jgi:para-nitrobenzyl esterase
MKTRNLSVCVLLLLLTSCAFALDGLVQTESGKITGVAASENSVVTVYKGIPYAAPPVGQLRWKPPQPVKAWAGVKPMDKFGNTCLQTKGWGSSKDMSEDCLYLNIWTPAKSEDEKLPVMFWIHGGGFTGGSGNLNGKPLAERGVVLVSINYRLGPLGFFAHPLLSKESNKGVSGNYGILDMVQALKWVQTNIGQFGGDKDNVTIFGESAGGTAVYILSSSDLTKGLFYKAIAESPWVTDSAIAPLTRPAYDQEAVETTGIRMAKMLCEDSEPTLTKLRDIDAADLVKRTSKGFKLPAAVEGYVLKDNPANLFEKGLQQSRPFIAGTNTDEGTMFSWGADKMTVEEYKDKARKLYKDSADDILEIYPVASKDQIKQAVNQSINDAWFAQPTRWMVRGMSKKNQDTYLYHFAHQGISWPAGGSGHAAELEFVFASLEPKKQTPSYKKLSNAMMTYWTQFAKTGNPNAQGLPEWPRYQETSDQNIVLDGDIRVESNYLKKNLDTLDRVYKAIGKYN